jgi:hypothetical protein
MIKEFKELVNAINSPDNEYRENDLDMLNYNMAHLENMYRLFIIKTIQLQLNMLHLREKNYEKLFSLWIKIGELNMKLQ